ncbi:GNAT family N-acetyltransferase [Fictibacillus gelatini]|uniref:GNAT family N-acetyltransferase n=3 Tax=Fictibacillus TaxID=1329200 RepID=UPI00041F53D3|nr:GNAT family N-acetyltransferase [Fictibacillus gelatini]
MEKVEPKLFQTKNGQTFYVKAALPEDAEKILAFNKAIISEAPYLVTTEAEFNITYDQEKELLKQMADDKGKLAIIAEYQGEVIGFLDFHNGHKERTKHQGAFGMSVAGIFRNQGVGKALLTVLLEWAKGNPLIEKVCLEVFADHSNAICLYKKLGFAEEGRKVKAIKIDSETYHDLIVMAHFTN